MNQLEQAPSVGAASVVDLYVRLERLESEMRELRRPSFSGRRGAPKTERSTWTEQCEPGDSGQETRPLTSSSAPTPTHIPWPTRRPIVERELLDVAATMSADAFVGVDADGTVRVWNQAAEDLFGWSFAEVVGRPVPFLTEDQEREHRGLIDYPRSVIAGQDLATIRRRRDGHSVPVRLRVQEGPRGGAMFAFREDVPPLDDLPDPRPAMERKAGPVVESELDPGLRPLVVLGRCAAGLAHDMNNILAVLQGYGELLREQSPETRLATMAGDIAHAAEQGGSVCRNLLSILKPENGTPPQSDLAAALKRSERIWRTILGAKISFKLVVAEGAVVARIHPGEFFQIILNLITNAADAMPDGGCVVLSLTIEDVVYDKAGLPSGRYAAIEMTDNGPGLPPEFVAGFGGTTRPETNHGLGLSTIRDILARNRGGMDFRNREGGGASIRIHIREA